MSDTGVLCESQCSRIRGILPRRPKLLGRTPEIFHLGDFRQNKSDPAPPSVVSATCFDAVGLQQAVRTGGRVERRSKRIVRLIAGVLPESRNHEKWHLDLP